MTIVRPPGVTCTDWIAASPGSRMCHEYAGQGGCNLPSRGVCEEWLKKNPDSPLAKLVPVTALVRGGLQPTPSADPPTSAPAVPPVLPQGALSASAAANDPYNPPPLVLAPPEPPPAKPLSPAARRAKEALEAAQGAGATQAPLPPVLPLDASDGDPLGEALEKRVKTLEALTDEITLATDYGEVHLVREHSPDTKRREITFRDMALLATVCAVFPGARIVQFHDKVAGEVREPVEEPAARPMSPSPSPPRPLLPGCPNCGKSFGPEKGQQEIVWCDGCNTYQNCRGELDSKEMYKGGPITNVTVNGEPVEGADDWMA